MADKQKNVIITKKAREKMVAARAGDTPLSIIEKMVFGDQGCLEDGTVKAPTSDQTGLTHQIFEKAIDSHQILENKTTCRYVCKLTEAECADQKISEIGLEDHDGDIVAIKTFLPKGKDSDIEMTFYLDDVF